MAKFLNTQYSFSNGQLNDRMLGRTDIREYFNSAKEITNYLVDERGGLNQVLGNSFKRYLTGDDTSNEEWPAAFSFDVNFQGNTYTYLLAYKRTGTAVTIGDFFNLYSLGTDGVAYRIAVSPYSSLSLTPGNFEYGTHLTYNDITIFTDKTGNYEPLVLYRDNPYGSSLRIATISDYATLVNSSAWSTDQKRWRFNSFSQDIDPLNTITVTGGNTLTASNAIFSSGMVGEYVRLDNLTTEYVVKIATFTNSYQVTYTNIEGAAPNAIYEIYGQQDWRSGAYPTGVSVFQERLILFNSKTIPNTLSLSATGGLFEFAVPLRQEAVLESDPFSITPQAKEESPVYWVESERYLSFGTSTEEFIVTPVNGVFSASSKDVTSVSKYGSSGVGLAFRAQSSTFFVERNGKTIREMTYSQENGGYTTRNIGVLGPDVGEISRIEYSYSSKRIYIENTNQEIFCCTIDKSSNTLAWSSIAQKGSIIGFYTGLHGIEDFDDFGSSLGITYFRSNTLLFNKSDGVLSGLEEYTTGNIYDKGIVGRDLALRIGVDYDISPTPPYPYTYFSQIPRDYFTNDGSIPTTIGVVYKDGTIDTAAPIVNRIPNINGNEYVEGLVLLFFKPITDSEKARIETNPIQQGSQIGDAQIAFNRVDKVAVRVKNTRSLKVGTTETSKYVEDKGSNISGLFVVDVDGVPEYDHTIIIENDSIYASTILGITSRGTGEVG